MVARHCPSNSWWESRSECWWCHGQAPIHVTLLTPAPSVIRSRNNEEWIIVFCRHTNVTQLLQVTACSDVHIAAPRWQLITIVCSQVSLWRCLFRPPMTGWWHGAGQWSAGRLMVYRGTPRWDPVQGTLPLLPAAVCQADRAGEIRYRPGLPSCLNTNIPQLLPWKNRIYLVAIMDFL